MDLLQVLCVGLLAAVAGAQEFPDCIVDATVSEVGSTEEATALTALLECSNGDFDVQWFDEVVIAETIRVTEGTSLNITGAGPGATVDGSGIVQLFVVEGGSLHLSDIALVNGYSSFYGGAIYAGSSIISFSGNTSFDSNSAVGDGGAIFAYSSTVSWDGDATTFSNNYSNSSGGAICPSYSN
ncbi:unnamed protein product, partial [Scytosiphon promiscuus]